MWVQDDSHVHCIARIHTLIYRLIPSCRPCCCSPVRAHAGRAISAQRLWRACLLSRARCVPGNRAGPLRAWEDRVAAWGARLPVARLQDDMPQGHGKLVCPCPELVCAVLV